ncbi:hypothetical protein ZHAS_00008748 [Anopheles sinensis]|uniref:Uncharacterized protein n=1 Tax=Anopheles sinensis TaxID=74873 RepID=A0A084VT91_ANOSI|nr:hypothetical protein ZHAS_00008748 [Anopheles sinensis]
MSILRDNNNKLPSHVPNESRINISRPTLSNPFPGFSSKQQPSPDSRTPLIPHTKLTFDHSDIKEEVRPFHIINTISTSSSPSASIEGILTETNRLAAKGFRVKGCETRVRVRDDDYDVRENSNPSHRSSTGAHQISEPKVSE